MTALNRDGTNPWGTWTAIQACTHDSATTAPPLGCDVAPSPVSAPGVVRAPPWVKAWKRRCLAYCMAKLEESDYATRYRCKGGTQDHDAQGADTENARGKHTARFLGAACPRGEGSL